MGYLTIIDGNRKHVFGNPDSKFKAELEVYSQEFYVFLGSGGTNGAAEAYHCWILGLAKPCKADTTYDKKQKNFTWS